MDMMNESFEHSKTLAGVGAILLLLGIVPYAGWVLAIVGVVLLVIGIKELSKYYQDENVYKNTLTGVKYYVVAVVAAGAAIVALMIGIASAVNFNFTNFAAANFVPTIGFGVGVAALLGGLIVAFIFYIFATQHLKRALDTLGKESGETSLATAGTLLWVGAILTIVLVGLVLIFIAWIFATMGFFGMKSRQYQQFTQQQGSGFTSPSPSSSQLSA